MSREPTGTQLYSFTILYQQGNKLNKYKLTTPPQHTIGLGKTLSLHDLPIPKFPSFLSVGW